MECEKSISDDDSGSISSKFKKGASISSKSKQGGGSTASKSISDDDSGSISSKFKKGASISSKSKQGGGSTASKSSDSMKYVGVSFGKKARYTCLDDSYVLQDMYGLESYGDLLGFLETARENPDLVSPNLSYSYGVPPHKFSSDPRIGSIAADKPFVLSSMRMNDSLARAGPRPEENMYSTPESRRFLHYMRTVGGQPDYKYPAPKTNNEETWRKRYEIWEEQEEEMLHGRDLRMATRALACFNLKFKTDYMVEEVLGSHKIDLGPVFFHCNFMARSKAGCERRLFFAEVMTAVDVNLCCILDDSVVRGCKFCGEEFVHPSEGSLQCGGV